MKKIITQVSAAAKHLLGVFVFMMMTYSLAAQVYWAGTISTDWNNAGNWLDGNIPTASDEVLILNGVPRMPEVLSGTATAQLVYVQSGATLTIMAAGILDIKGATGYPLGCFFIEGTVTNHGRVTLGQTATPGDYGLVNEGTFLNSAGGTFLAERFNNIAVWNRGSAAVLTNAGSLTANLGDLGSGANIYNEGTIHNNVGGEIKTDKNRGAGLNNRPGATVTNAGRMLFGLVGGNSVSIFNFSHFENRQSGVITIINSDAGIFNTTSGSNSVFINEGRISIGVEAKTNSPGIINEGFSGESITFENRAGGVIELGDTRVGIHN
ncbi:MAG: hypothetical protein R2795_04915, partial [Saprospiraceae bacterium]